MGTRKLFTSLAFVFFFTAGSAQDHSLNASKASDKISAAGEGVEELKVSKDAVGKNVITWRSTGLKPVEFLLQGSKDGKVFRAIRRLPASSSGMYQTSDEAHPGFSCFRIICIDHSGRFSYSEPASAR